MSNFTVQEERNLQDSDLISGNVALHDVLENNPSPELLESLLININESDVNKVHPITKNSPLMTAIQKKCPAKIVFVLLKHKANPNFVHPITRKTPLLEGIQQGSSTELLNFLLLYNANVNISNSLTGQTPLLEAIEQGASEEFLKLLLQNGANPNTFDFIGENTPLLCALNNKCSKELVKFFIKKGANINTIFHSDGNTLVHRLCLSASKTSDVRVLQKILEFLSILLSYSQTNVFIKNYKGQTPQDIVSCINRQDPLFSRFEFIPILKDMLFQKEWSLIKDSKSEFFYNWIQDNGGNPEIEALSPWFSTIQNRPTSSTKFDEEISLKISKHQSESAEITKKAAKPLPPLFVNTAVPLIPIEDFSAKTRIIYKIHKLFNIPLLKIAEDLSPNNNSVFSDQEMQSPYDQNSLLSFDLTNLSEDSSLNNNSAFSAQEMQSPYDQNSLLSFDDFTNLPEDPSLNNNSAFSAQEMQSPYDQNSLLSSDFTKLSEDPSLNNNSVFSAQEMQSPYDQNSLLSSDDFTNLFEEESRPTWKHEIFSQNPDVLKTPEDFDIRRMANIFQETEKKSSFNTTSTLLLDIEAKNTTVDHTQTFA